MAGAHFYVKETKMIKKNISYIDYNGIKCSDDYYFHLNNIEWLRLDSKYDGIQDFLKQVIKGIKPRSAVMDLLEDLILSAYGEKSEDGKKFIKTKELRDDFAQSEPYSELFTSFLQDTQKGIDFFNALAPKDLPNKPTEVANKE